MKASQAAAVLLESKHWKKEELLARGAEVYDRDCAICHQQNGEGLAGVFPALARNDVVTGPLSEHLNALLRNRHDTAGLGLVKHLNDADIAAVVSFERQAWGNRAQDIVQPADVAAVRKDSRI